MYYKSCSRKGWRIIVSRLGILIELLPVARKSHTEEIRNSRLPSENAGFREISLAERHSLRDDGLELVVDELNVVPVVCGRKATPISSIKSLSASQPAAYGVDRERDKCVEQIVNTPLTTGH